MVYDINKKDNVIICLRSFILIFFLSLLANSIRKISKDNLISSQDLFLDLIKKFFTSSLNEFFIKLAAALLNIMIESFYLHSYK